jgi:hypothetical protein
VAKEDKVTFGVLANALGLALACALLGRRDRAAQLLKDAEGAMRRPLPALTRDGALPAAARIAIGHIDEALREIDEGLALVDRLGVRRYRPALLRLRAEALASTPSPSDAPVDCWQEARALALELNMRPEQVLCDLSLGRFYAQANDSSLARVHLAQASASARQLHMISCAACAEKELEAL